MKVLVMLNREKTWNVAQFPMVFTSLISCSSEETYMEDVFCLNQSRKEVWVRLSNEGTESCVTASHNAYRSRNYKVLE